MSFEQDEMNEKSSLASMMPEDSAPPSPLPDPPAQSEHPDKVFFQGRWVSNKKANRPFLKSHKWPEHMLSQKASSAPQDPMKISTTRTLLRYIVVLTLGVLLMSKMFTETWLWGYTGKWSKIKTYFPPPQRLYSESELSRYDGSDPALPLLLAIDGDVFDVSANKGFYGKGGGYHSFVGHDGARAFATGCFATHQTHDKRGLTPAELKVIQDWKNFFDSKYLKIGTVTHKPIDPNSLPPPPCEEPKPQKS